MLQSEEIMFSNLSSNCDNVRV